MSILISRATGGYLAEVTPPHGRGVPWTSPEPLDVPELVHELLRHGCHQTDIGDAFYDADENWLSDAEDGGP